MEKRTQYVLSLEGLADAVLIEAARTALTLVASEMASAETDIPWGERGGWPADVVEAAQRLSDRFGQGRDDTNVQTGVRAATDSQVREDFITFAPHAYDATFWREDYATVASLSDAGTSFVIWLTEQQRANLTEVVHAERVISMRDWRLAHSSRWWTGLFRLSSAKR
ncbi:hypothetical protein [Phycicoccus jejuensis]|uniref:hypothetical protein n=1 Tax=Phycicoccus jejuensis TaxID=367299 RepID=UPI0004C318B4|nr:hypothetical protein [Phycicoccus jejuensis]